MQEERSKRLGKILESANESESRRRRSQIASVLWGLLIVLLLVGLFFAGSALQSPQVDSAEGDPGQEKPATSAVDGMTPDAAPIAEEIPESVPGALPTEVRLLAAAELHVRRSGKVVGVVSLHPGDSVRPIERVNEELLVARGDAEGIVPVSATTLAPPKFR